MSDFLDQLITRSLGLGEVIRPRARLLFEPQPADTAPIAPAAFGSTEVEELGPPPQARALPPSVETVERNDREPARAQVETASTPAEQITRVTEPIIRRTSVENAATRLRTSPLLEPRDVASGIRPEPVKVEGAPRL
ncbi:MAG: hypothetical protein ACRDPM_02830, partial [Solirubrobacteraceae bacterium]